MPIAGQVSLGLNAKVSSFTLLSVLKLWNTGAGPWNFASGMTVPYMSEETTATLTGPSRPFSTSQSVSNFFDLYFTPIVTGYHFSKTEHIALSFNVWAPTGQYDPKALANTSLNNWTFIPSVGYTRLFPEQGLEFDATLGVLHGETTRPTTRMHPS